MSTFESMTATERVAFAEQLLAEAREQAGAQQANIAVDTDRSLLQQGGVGYDAGEAPQRDLHREGYAAFDAAIRGGRRREDAASEIINRLTHQAILGNTDALVQEWSNEDLTR